MKHQKIRHEFVDYVPEELKEGIIYVSIQFATVVHKCLCGCGREVVTPLSPVDWTLIFDGQTISLNPSIGNWSFPCQSHYWIRQNQVKWAAKLSQKEINTGRMYDRLLKEKYFNVEKKPTELEISSNGHEAVEGFWKRLKRLFSFHK